MNGPQRDNQHNQLNICNFQQFKNNNNTLRNDDFQWNMNSSRVNDNNFFIQIDDSTSQNSTSHNGTQKSNAQINQNLPLIDLSAEENVTKDDKVIIDEEQETMKKSENFDLYIGSKVEIDNHKMMVASKTRNDETYEIQDLSKSSTKPQEAPVVLQEKKETVSDHDSHFDIIFKYSEINKAAISQIIKNNIARTLEENLDENDNVKKLIENASDVMKMKILYDRIYKLLQRPQTEVVKPSKEQYTQTDKNNNNKYSQTETYIKPCNKNHRNNTGVVQKHPNPYIRPSRLKYPMMVQDDPTQQSAINNQQLFLQEGMDSGHVMTGQEIVRNPEPMMMPYPYQPAVDYNISRPAVARHPYTVQHSNRPRSQNGRNLFSPNVQPRPQYRQYPVTQNLDWDMATSTNNYPNFQGFQNQYSNF